MKQGEDLDLQIVLEIVKFLRIRREQSVDDALIKGALENLFQDLPPGVKIGSVFDMSKTTVLQENSMGDTYIAGQAAAQGPNASATGQSFTQIWNQNTTQIDLNQLARELANIREEVQRAGSKSPEEAVAVAELAQAEIAAKSGDGEKALSHLSRAGKWALGIATSIGVPVATKAIQLALGMS